MKRLLACIMVLCLLCGQAALGENSAAAFTRGVEYTAHDIWFELADGAAFEVAFTVRLRAVMSDQYDAVQASFAIVKGDTALMDIWIEQLPDGKEYCCLSNQRTKIDCPQDPISMIGDLLAVNNTLMEEQKQLYNLSGWMKQFDEILSSEETIKKYAESMDGGEYLGNGQCRFSAPNAKMIMDFQPFTPDGPLFDLSDRKAVAFTSMNELMSTEGVAEAVLETAGNLMQEESIMKLMGYLQSRQVVPPQPQETAQPQETTKPASHRMEVVNALRELGIEITDQFLADTEKAWAEWNQEWEQGGLPRFDYYGEDYPVNLLAYLGMGDYDPNTWEWKPSSSDVYSFDAEVADIEHMYSQFFQGISAIIPGFEVTDVRETIEEFEQVFSLEEKIAQGQETGILPADGTTTVTFTLNGHPYEKVLGFYGDWFDGNAIDWINEVLAQEGFPGRIRYFSDGGQGYILLYGDDAFARSLEAILGQPDIGTMENK